MPFAFRHIIKDRCEEWGEIAQGSTLYKKATTNASIQDISYPTNGRHLQVPLPTRRQSGPGIVPSPSDLLLHGELLPDDDSQLGNEEDYDDEESFEDPDEWEDLPHCYDDFYQNMPQERNSFDEAAFNHDDLRDLPTDPRFLLSGWGGECLRETEDIDFEFVYALHTFVATVEGQANATKGDTMVLLDDSNSYWWLVRVVKDSTIGRLRPCAGYECGSVTDLHRLPAR